MKIVTEKVVKYYVQAGDGYVYGGPFYTRDEAEKCLRDYHDRMIGNRPDLPPQVPRACNDSIGWQRLK